MKENKSYYIETFGCQMNIADSEVVAAVLYDAGYSQVQQPEAADLVLLNTCAVRDNAEQRVWNKLQHFKGLKKKHKPLKIGILGCMAQRVGNGFEQSKVVDFIAGPDSYRNLPELIKQTSSEAFASALELSRTETYEALLPRRIDQSKLSGFVSITRGCNNFCSYCIVPYTRGRERSRNPGDVLNEIDDLQQKGYKEITLLGQNVNSYHQEEDGQSTGFTGLLTSIATQFPKLRIRFTTSHPKDISDALIETIAGHSNICNHIHLPVQSGSNDVLKIMNRGYTREWYLDRIHKIKTVIPGCGLSTDVFAGFPGETEADHKASMSLMQQVKFDSAFMFRYSERPGTYAAKHLKDDVPEETKIRRLNELITLQNQLSLESNKNVTGKHFDILIEGKSKRSDKDVFGRTETNKLVIVPDNNYKPGNIIKVIIGSYTSATLFGKAI
ncbi:MAG: tRNA (N6-isopentenyl adenosine(37)-C2)-methylthiotransferase MiaB [Candidatus Delongbacteria bacterium]|jgi:tRNA-2-methylthio-N6-dimethylallyladenosine synthase|nr:tRNA (N6-isopentenyl adenosine(37)-C2)-methylthiotransferase MiaB [Candidatus Delongbacteria bacterium]